MAKLGQTEIVQEISDLLGSQGEILGNFHQAFTRLALINTCVALEKALNLQE